MKKVKKLMKQIGILISFYLTRFFSNSSNDFPLVSGTTFIINKKPITAIIPKIRNVSEFPKVDNSQGNTN